MKYLDYNGLQTVVENVKNLIPNSKLLVYNGEVSLGSTIYVNPNSVAVPTIVVYDTNASRFLAKRGVMYYAKWSATDTYLDYTKYGTVTTSGVTPSPLTLYYDIDTFKFTACIDGDTTALSDLTSSIFPKWNTVKISDSPFVDADGYVSKVERRESKNDTYIWRITIDNSDGEYQEWDVYKGSRYICPGVYLEDGASDCFTMELPKSVAKNTFTIQY